MWSDVTVGQRDNTENWSVNNLNTLADLPNSLASRKSNHRLWYQQDDTTSYKAHETTTLLL